MKAQDYKRAVELYSGLRELPESEWAAAVASDSAGNAEFKAEVMRLLHAEKKALSGRFLERPALKEAAEMLDREFDWLPEMETLAGRYRIRSRIGSGGMGVVYEAQDERLERRVALKLLPLSSSPGAEERIRRFEREARVISQLNHPNIISIFDADFDQGCYFIAMEYVEGQTLRSLLAASKRGLDAKTVLKILSQTASAMTAAHEAGIVHRDIKPENIMLRADGLVKVLDFGLAAMRDPLDAKQGDWQTRPGHLAGTVKYLSPEQVAGKPATPRSDLFSLGVVGYELVTGVEPFDGPTDGMIFSAILNVAAPPPSVVRPDLGPELDPLLMALLEKDPELRYQTASDLRSSCRRLLRDSSSSIGIATQATPSTVQPARARIPRVSALFWRAAAALLFLSVAASLFWYTWPRPMPRVTRIYPVTTGTNPIFHFANDGTRVYYAAGKEDPQVRMFQVSINGGEPVAMPNLTGMFPLDISPDHAELLLGQYVQGTTNGPYPLWLASTLGSSPRRLGDIYGSYARWSPSGDQILYSIGPELRVAQSDGGGSRTIAKLKADVFYPCWSPDGSRIRLGLSAKSAHALWEIRPDGTGLHMVLAQWEGLTSRGGDWTPDGRYFVFSALQGGVQDLWAAPETHRFLPWVSHASAARLTTGPINADSPQVSSNGRDVLFQGSLRAGELVRYDTTLRQWLPYLAGLAAEFVGFSRDGRWIAYASYPDGSLWRSRVDGTERMRLTAPPLRVLNPFWSPDGKQIVFSANSPGQPSCIYTVSAAGGEAHRWTKGDSGPGGEADADWAPDGTSLVFSSRAREGQATSALFQVDLHSGRIAAYPGSENLWGPRSSPDGRHIAVLERSSFALWLYDTVTHRRTQLTEMAVGWPTWSRDGRNIYFEDNATTGWYRLALKDKKLFCITAISNLKFAESTLGWIGMPPDGSLIATRDAGSTQIYALDWEKGPL